MTTTYAVRDIFVEANGLRHHLIARGTPGSPVVMMIHGLAGQAHAFDAIANHLAAKYHVYCLDVRGRGESAWGPADQYGVDTYVADLEAVREALGLQRMAASSPCNTPRSTRIMSSASSSTTSARRSTPKG
jgi:pimeloyl-ACP methyl ester carboxylesterase